MLSFSVNQFNQMGKSKACLRQAARQLSVAHQNRNMRAKAACRRMTFRFSPRDDARYEIREIVDNRDIYQDG
jgi:hypothetical protein